MEGLAVALAECYVGSEWESGAVVQCQLMVAPRCRALWKESPVSHSAVGQTGTG